MYVWNVVSIHAFREEGDTTWHDVLVVVDVSIHAFREEGDYFQVALSQPVIWFQSTPSGRKATRSSNGVPYVSSVSIHAFREEGDATAGKEVSS